MASAREMVFAQPGVEVAPVERGERQQEILPVFAGIVVAIPVVGIALLDGDRGAVAQVKADIDLVGADEIARPGREIG